jgi:predicted nucleic acid-binding protein
VKRYVLDSYALIAFLDREHGFEKVSAVFDECVTHNEPALMSMVNWGEVYYIALRAGGEKMALIALDTMRALPLTIVPPDAAVTLLGAQYKEHHKMSYADAFAAALAKTHAATLVTGDKEFKVLHGELHILWLTGTS